MVEIPSFLLTLYTKWDIILFALEQYKFVFYALKGGGTKVEKDCGAWINLLSHMVKARLDTTLQDLDITGMQSRVIYYILVHFQEGNSPTAGKKGHYSAGKRCQGCPAEKPGADPTRC